MENPRVDIVFPPKPSESNYPNHDDYMRAVHKYYAGIDVSKSFDRSKTYIRILRPADKKYRPGYCGPENTNAKKYQYPPEFDFDKPSGFYFSDLCSFFYFAFGWGTQLCYVTVPEGARIAIVPSHCSWSHEAVWRADRIILSEPIDITPALIEEFVERGAKLEANTLSDCMTSLGAEFIRRGGIKKKRGIHKTAVVNNVKATNNKKATNNQEISATDTSSVNKTNNSIVDHIYDFFPLERFKPKSHNCKELTEDQCYKLIHTMLKYYIPKYGDIYSPTSS